MIRHQVVTRLRAPLGTDEYGNRARAWEDAATAELAGFSVQPLGGEEETTDRQTVVTRAQLWGPSGTDLESTDRVVAEGVTYEIDGPVHRWPAPGGGEHHINANLRKVVGG